MLEWCNGAIFSTDIQGVQIAMTVKLHVNWPKYYSTYDGGGKHACLDIMITHEHVTVPF